MEHEKQQVIITIGREYGSGGHLMKAEAASRLEMLNHK